VKSGKDICHIKLAKNFIAFGFAEDVNPAREEGAHMPGCLDSHLARRRDGGEDSALVRKAVPDMDR
jgi:hypothetical protein